MSASMDDLAMVRLCAEACGLDFREFSRNHPSQTIRLKAEPNGDYYVDYWPLTDDAQAMALVKRYPNDCIQAMRHAYADAFRRWTPATFDAEPPVNFNRAIVQCVATLQSRRSGGQGA